MMIVYRQIVIDPARLIEWLAWAIATANGEGMAALYDAMSIA